MESYNISCLPANPVQGHIFTIQEVLDNLGESVVDKFLYIGIFVLICGLWNTFRNPDNHDDAHEFITYAVNMAGCVAGIASIVFYLAYKYDWVIL